MTQWGNTDDAANSVSWAAASLGQGSGKAAQLANNTAFYNNVSVGVWKNNNTAIHNTMGQFGVSRAEMANTTGESGKVTHPGWQIRRQGMGPLVGVTAANGSAFANGETVTVSGGTTNAVVTLTSNATENLVSGVVSSPGLFSNASSLSFAFNREKHVSAISSLLGTGYSNTDYIVVSNGSVNAYATITEVDANGTFDTANIVITSVGLFGNTQVAGNVVVTVFAANGAVSNGADVVLTPTLATSVDGAVGGAINACCQSRR
jgi:hypothetical protein